MSDNDNSGLRDLVAEVASAYFVNSHVGVGDIRTVIEQIATELIAVTDAGSASDVSTPELPRPKSTTAQIRKSIRPDVLISFEDGRPYKTLRRHLSIRGLTPDLYREKWGLPRDYPMVAANYSADRSRMAKQIGLGVARAVVPARRRSGPPAVQAET